MNPKHGSRIHQEPCQFHAQMSEDGNQGQRSEEKSSKTV